MPSRESTSGPAVDHVVVGAGRWGTWLARRLQGQTARLRAVVGASQRARDLANELGVAHWARLNDPRGAIVWLCLPDDGLRGFAEAHHTRLAVAAGVVHAAGSAPSLRVDCPSGVCWPIQSITREREPDWGNLRLAVEADGAAFAKTLHEIAGLIGDGHPLAVTTASRQRLHLAATLTQNFSNLLWDLAAEVLAEAQLDYRDLLPLARNHLDKLGAVSPRDLQTGPAVRQDTATLELHEQLLAGHDQALRVYAMLSEIIGDRARARE